MGAVSSELVNPTVPLFPVPPCIEHQPYECQLAAVGLDAKGLVACTRIRYKIDKNSTIWAKVNAAWARYRYKFHLRSCGFPLKDVDFATSCGTHASIYRLLRVPLHVPHGQFQPPHRPTGPSCPAPRPRGGSSCFKTTTSSD
jgi:hypothetical protein